MSNRDTLDSESVRSRQSSIEKKKKNIFEKKDDRSSVKDSILESEIDFQMLASPEQKSKNELSKAKPFSLSLNQTGEKSYIETLIEQSLIAQDSDKTFKDKMCRLVSDEYVEDAIKGRPGQPVYLTWKIENDSKYDWPRFPILKNVTAS